MKLTRRTLLKSAALGGACALAGPAAAGEKAASGSSPRGYTHRIAFGAWINDMRSEPLPLENWPAPQLDEITIQSALAAMDVQREAGFNVLDNFGLFATTSYPLDVASAFADPERRRKVVRLLEEAAKRGLKTLFGMGLFTWGFDEIIRRDVEVCGKDSAGKPHPHAMCGAKENAWKYIEKILDSALGQFDFGGVHLESADLGWCECPECAGKYGRVGYNVRLNVRAAQYIRSKWPGKLITVIPINWVGGPGHEHFNEEEKKQIVELSRHVDCFMDQGWRGTFIAPAERKDFVRRLECAYGTSGGLWLYHSARYDRTAYFLPYARRAGKAIQEHFQDGARACMFYQGPMVNPAVEVNTAVGGRMLADASRSPEDALAEVIGRYYKPKSIAAHKKLVELFLRAEEAYFGQWDAKRFRAVHNTQAPGEFKINDALWGHSPDPALYLLEPYLNAEGRQAYKTGLKAILKDLAAIEGDFDDGGRVRRIQRGIIITLSLINTVRACKNEPWSAD